MQKKFFAGFYISVKIASVNYVNNCKYNRNKTVSNSVKESVKENTYPACFTLSIMSDSLFNYHNISFTGAKAAFYSIDADGNYQRFTDRKTAENTLSLAKSNIAECLQGKRSVTHGYGFVYAGEIEREDENGNLVIDEAKLNEKINDIQAAMAAKDIPTPVYAVDEKGNYKRFESKYQASKTLGISTPGIIKVVNGELKKTGGYTFVTPDKIEKKDETGKSAVDKKKLAKIIHSAFEENNSTPVYAIDENGVYRKYSGIRKAASELSLKSADISRCLSGNQKRVGRYTFVRAEEVETADENNKVMIDNAKLKKINEETLVWNSYVPIYAVDANGNCKRFVNKKRAARELGMDNSAIGHCLDGKYNVVNGYAFAYAEDVEAMGENGETVINYDILKEKYEQANKNSVYAVYRDGSYKKYTTQMEAANELGLSRRKISLCINGGSTRVSGRIFVKASDVESYEHGNVYVNKNLMKKFALELASSNVRAVYSFDEDGAYQRFNSVKDTVQSLSVSKSCVFDCLNGKKETNKGYRFIYADTVETFDDEGNIVVDYDKLDEIAEQINPSIKKLMSKYGKIYAIQDMNIYEFDNLRKAARALNIDENSIIYFLKNGRNPADGKNSINGLVLTSEIV